MTEQKTILESWVKYIDLESLEQAKFDPEKTNTKQFWEFWGNSGEFWGHLTYL